MKLIAVLMVIILFGIFNLLSIHSAPAAILDNGKPVYKVYKIDSINNYYLIYALKDSIRYKVVSPKANAKKGMEKNEIGGVYKFKLHSRFEYPNRFNDPLVRTQVSCHYYDDSTAICLERKNSIMICSGVNRKMTTK
jgi:hypothetical protein